MTQRRHAGEPPLSELLEDPITHALMRRDGVTMAALLDLIEDAQHHLADEAAPRRCAAGR
jgi:hypothetical protein